MRTSLSNQKHFQQIYSHLLLHTQLQFMGQISASAEFGGERKRKISRKNRLDLECHE